MTYIKIQILTKDPRKR